MADIVSSDFLHCEDEKSDKWYAIIELGLVYPNFDGLMVGYGKNGQEGQWRVERKMKRSTLYASKIKKGYRRVDPDASLNRETVIGIKRKIHDYIKSAGYPIDLSVPIRLEMTSAIIGDEDASVPLAGVLKEAERAKKAEKKVARETPRIWAGDW